MKHIQNRNGHLYFRLKIPEDCRATLNGKCEVTKSLRLRENQMKEAVVQAGVMAREWWEAFDSIRNSNTKKPLSFPIPEARPLEEVIREEVIHQNARKMLDELLNDLGMKQCQNTLKEIKRTYDLVSELLDSKELDGSTLKKIYALSLLGGYNGKIPPTKGNVEKTLPSYPISDRNKGMIPHTVWTLAETLGIQNRQRILRGVLRVLLEELQYIANEIVKSFPKLDMVKQWSRIITHGTIATSSYHLPVSSASDSLSISEVLAECLAIKKRTIRTENDIRKEVLTFLAWHEINGNSVAIDSITVSHMIDYRSNCLQHIPRHANKLKETKNLPVREQVAYGIKHQCRTISITTLNNRLTNLGIVFGYAKRKHYVNFSVSEGLHLANEKKLAKLSGALFSGYSNAQMTELVDYLEKHKSNHRKGCEWHYWIPLLLAYTGCRANEIAMLTADDVKNEGGIWYLGLQNNEAKRQRVKNAMSVRRVPICQRIIDLGFIEYAGTIRKGITSRKNQEGRLWGTLTYSETSRWIRQLSRYFNKTIRPALNAQDISSGLHGLRSSVCRALQRHNVNQRIIDELTGHQPEGISRVALGYQGRLELEVLAKAVETISWHNLT